MAFLDQSATSAFLGKAPTPKVPTPTPDLVTKQEKQETEGVVSAWIDNAMEATGNVAKEYIVKPAVSAWNYKPQFLTELEESGKKQGDTIITKDPNSSMAKVLERRRQETAEQDAKEAKEDEEKKIRIAKEQESKMKMQSNFSTAFGEEIKTKSPRMRTVASNIIEEATKHYTELDQIIDGLEYIEYLPERSEENTWTATQYNSIDKYKKVLNNEIIPAQQELIKRQMKYMENGESARYAYLKMLEDPESKAMAERISDFSSNLTADSNSAALKKFQMEGQKFNAVLGTLGKIGDNVRYTAQATNINMPSVGISDYKLFGNRTAREFSNITGGAAADATEIGKMWYGTKSNVYEAVTGLPTALPTIGAFATPTGIPGMISKAPGAVNAISKLTKSEKIIDATADVLKGGETYIKNSPKTTSLITNMVEDTFKFDPAVQVFLGRGMTEDDIKENFIFNLPINMAIASFARNPKIASQLVENFDLTKTIDEQGNISLSKYEIDLIKGGQSDLAELSILNRSKLGETAPQELINVRNLGGDKDLAKKVYKVGENLKQTVERAKNKTETAYDTTLLATASAGNIVTKDMQKTIQNFTAYKGQQAINKEIEKTLQSSVEGDNANKFWTTKLVQAGKDGVVDIDTAINRFVKANPEYATAAQMLRKMTGILPNKDFNLNTLIHTPKSLNRQLGKMVKEIYDKEIVQTGKLIEGERLSPVHIFKDGKVFNIENGETTDPSKFFKRVVDSVYQKKALAESVLGDLAGNAEVFEFFTKKLQGDDRTDSILRIFSKKSFSRLTEREAYLIRASLANEILADLKSKGKKADKRSLFTHPVYRLFKKAEDGTYFIDISNPEDLQKDLGKIFETMDEMEIVKYLADVKSIDEIKTGLGTVGVKTVVSEIIKNQPPFMKTIWEGFSEMLMRKTSVTVDATMRLPRVNKQIAVKMIKQLQKAFPNIPLEFGTLPEGTKGMISNFGGKIIIDESKMTDFTSLHEFGHIWIMHSKSAEPEIYKAMSESVVKSPYYSMVQKEYSSFYTETSDFIDEAIAHAIEDSGARFFNLTQKKTFMERFVALIQSVFTRISSIEIDGMTDKAVAKMFNTAGKPVSEKSLAELDFLQFNKEDFDKNGYFIRHVIQKISEDNLFLTMAKNASSVEEQEFIYQIINAMINNTIPAPQLAKTVTSYAHGFQDYLGLVNKDAFTESYLRSEISKMENSAVLRSVVSEIESKKKWTVEEMFNIEQEGAENSRNAIRTKQATDTENKNKPIDNLKSKLANGGIDVSDKSITGVIDKALIQMAKNLGIKRLFFTGSRPKNMLFFNELQNTINTIKQSDMSIMQKQKALIEQSIAFSREFLMKVYENTLEGKKTVFTYRINGRDIDMPIDIFYKILQTMRLPEFAGSALTLSEYLKDKRVTESLKKYLDLTVVTTKQIEADKAKVKRIVSQIPVDELPAAKNTVIITTGSKNKSIAYAQYEDNRSMYMTIDDFLKTDVKKDTNYLISANFFGRSIQNPEMRAFIDKTENTPNVYPVGFSVAQENGKMFVEMDGYDVMRKFLLTNHTATELPNFKFDRSPSKRSLSRLSENSANTATRKELSQILDDVYEENPNAEKLLTEIGVNPVLEPTVSKNLLIHSFGEYGKIGEIYRQILRELDSRGKERASTYSAIQPSDYITSDKFIITDNIKNEYIESLQGTADLASIYIKGKTVDEIIDQELALIDTQNLLDDLTEELNELMEKEIYDTDFQSTERFKKWREEEIAIMEDRITTITSIIEQAKGRNLKGILEKAEYPTGKEAFNEVVKTLKREGFSYTETSSIVRTILTEYPAWKADILKSDATEFLPSFDSFLVARMASPLIDEYKVDKKLFNDLLETAYDKVNAATFKKHYPENDSILHLFFTTLQRYGVIDEGDDVFAITANIDPEMKKKLHSLINGVYEGDFQKIALDENIDAYMDSTFNILYRQFTEGMRVRGTGGSNQKGSTEGMNDSEKMFAELSDTSIDSELDLYKTGVGSESDDGKFTMNMSITAHEGNTYHSVMKDFIGRLIDYRAFELDSISPSTFNFEDTKGTPLFESTINLNIWASQPDHKVITKTVGFKNVEYRESGVPAKTPANATLGVIEATPAKISDHSTRLKMYDIFNGMSESTMKRYQEYDAISVLENTAYGSKEDLESAFNDRGIQIRTEPVHVTRDALEEAIEKPERFMSKNVIKNINEYIKTYQGGEARLAAELRESLWSEFTYIAEYYASDAVKFLEPKEEIVEMFLSKAKKLANEKAKDSFLKINNSLLNKILTNVISTLEAYRYKKISGTSSSYSAHPIFTMVTKTGVKREYFLNTLNNSPVFRMLMDQIGTLKSKNPILQLLEAKEIIENKYLKEYAHTPISAKKSEEISNILDDENAALLKEYKLAEFKDRKNSGDKFFTNIRNRYTTDKEEETLIEKAQTLLDLAKEEYSPAEKFLISQGKFLMGRKSIQAVIRRINKVNDLFAETVGLRKPTRSNRVNQETGEISTYAIDDDNIYIAKEHIGNSMAIDFGIPASIDDITAFTPIKAEGEGYEFKLEKGSMESTDQIDYGRILPEYLDSYDFKFVYTDWTQGSDKFGKQFEAMMTFEGKEPELKIIREVQEDIPQASTKIKEDPEFDYYIDESLCEIPFNLL